MEYVVKFYMSSAQVGVTMPGKMTLELPDGTKYSMQSGECLIEGLMNKQKILNIVNELEVRDLTNNIVARTAFDAGKEKRNTGLTRFFKGADKVNKDGVYENRKDLLKTEIIQLSEDQDPELLDTATGSYLEKVKFDNDEEPMWTINEKVY